MIKEAVIAQTKMFSLVVESGWEVGDLNATTKGFTLCFVPLLRNAMYIILHSFHFLYFLKYIVQEKEKSAKHGNTAENLEFQAGLDFSLYIGEPLKCHLLGRGHSLAYC